jgi:hypothetical protein
MKRTMTRAVVLIAVMAVPALAGAQVRIVPPAAVAAPQPSKPQQSTWASKLYGLHGPATATVPKPPNGAACTDTLALPDSMALVSGPGGLENIDAWQARTGQWTTFEAAPAAIDTLRARVVGADCPGLWPLRIWLRSGSDYLTAYATGSSPRGIFVIDPAGELTPAMISESASTRTVHVGPMSPALRRHLADAPPSSQHPLSVMVRCVAAGQLQARTSDEMMARLAAVSPDPLNAPPSADEMDARDANIISICKTAPGVFLPELR